MLFTECQKKISFKSYAPLKFQILVAILINFGQKLRFFDISLKSYLVSQFWSKLAGIWTRSSLDNFAESQRDFFENFDFYGFILIFLKRMENIDFFRFYAKNSAKSQKIKIFKKASLILFKIIQRWSGPNFSQFGPKLWD